MNKTVSISLSGQVFQVDEQAYDILKVYLDNIRRRFVSTDGGQEIIADIESRIAELFLEKLNVRKQVITTDDVEAMMQAMGKPEDFETAAGDESQSTTAQPEGTRRLFRNPDERVLGGVCSGLSAYFGIDDPVWMRLLFIILFFMTAGFVIYLILWVIIPEAKTASEKLQMRGKHVNISNIEKEIRDDINALGKRITNINSGDTVSKAKGIFHQIVDLCVKLILWVVKVIGRLLGVALIIVGLATIIGISIVLFIPSVTFISVEALYPAIFATKTQFLMVTAGFVLVVILPAIAILFAGFQLLLNTRRRLKGLAFTIISLWIVGAVLMGIFISLTASDFRQTGTIRTEILLTQPAKDTLVLESVNRNTDGSFYELPGVGEFVETDSQLIFTQHVKLDIKRSATNDYQLIQTYRANGRKGGYAEKRAGNIMHELKQTDSALTVGESITVPKSDHYRGQEVYLLLRVPEGKAVYLSESVANILYDVQNTQDMYDRDMVNHTWMMLPEGLTCIDCSTEDLSRNHFPQGAVSRKLEFKDFTGIDAQGAFNLEVKQGAFSVTASGSRKFVDEIDITKEDGKLVIGAERSGFWNRKPGTVTVTLPVLDKLEIAGANTAIISGFEQEKMSLDVMGASKVNFKSSVKELELDEEGASTVILSGTGNLLTAEVNGASHLNAFNYEVERGDVEANGASEAEVNAAKKLAAEANGASKIRYKGLPEISSDVTGYSSIQPEQ